MADARITGRPAWKVPHEAGLRISPLMVTLVALSAHGWLATMLQWAMLARTMLAGTVLAGAS